jgi:hypothetical protein
MPLSFATPLDNRGKGDNGALEISKDEFRIEITCGVEDVS